MPVVKGDIVISHGIKAGPCELIAQYGGIALYKGIQVLFGDEVAGDGLYLSRRAAVEGGYGYAVAYSGRGGGDVIRKLRIELLANFHALLEYGGVGCVAHTVDKCVHLGGLYALKVIAHAHVEHKSIGSAKAVYLADDTDGEPCLYVFVKGLRNIQLGGPFAVVALVLGPDAGAVYAGGKVIAVHLLHGLKLKEAGACVIGRHDILGQLGIGACGGAKGSLQLFLKDGKHLIVFLYIGGIYAEHGAALGVLIPYPGHKLLKGDRCHSFAHFAFPP